MKFAAAVVILLASAPLAVAAPAASKNAKPKAPAKSAAPASKTSPPAKTAAVAPIKSTAPIVETPRLRHETIGIQPGYGSIEADSAALARKEDDTAFARALVSPVAAAPRPAGPFAAVEATVLKRKPQATGRLQISFDVDRRGHVQRAIVVGIDKNLDRAIEAQLKKTVLPAEYVGQHVDTVLAFQKGKLLRR